MPLFHSCTSTSTTFYHPNEAHMMGVSEKGDLKVSGSFRRIGTGSFIRSNSQNFKKHNLQLAYSPIKRIVMVSSYFNITSSFDAIPVSETFRNMEFSLGYYNKFGINNKTDKSYFLPNVYLGTGTGNKFNQFETAGMATVNYQRYFLHGGVHWGFTKNHLKFGLGVRYVHLRYKSAVLIGKIPEYYERRFSQIKDLNQRNFVEASSQVQVGFTTLKAYARVTAVFTNPNMPSVGDPNASVGIIVELDEIWKILFPKKIKTR